MKLAKQYTPNEYEPTIYAMWETANVFAPTGKGKPFSIAMPPPNANGDLHIGHWYAMTGPDIVARMHRMQGFNVMFPMGFDGFGLPAENAAIDRGIHPATWTYQNIDNMRRQMRLMGASFDWNREVWITYVRDECNEVKKVILPRYTFEVFGSPGV